MYLYAYKGACVPVRTVSVYNLKPLPIKHTISGQSFVRSADSLISVGQISKFIRNINMARN
jgi:hypothetical protein